jgi:small subunit ribosomal protein S15
MILTAETKKELFKKHGNSETNTGSPEAQIAMFTLRISHLTGHLQTNKKDFGTQKALINLVGKRKSLLNYLKNKDIERYRAILKTLDLRK